MTKLGFQQPRAPSDVPECIIRPFGMGAGHRPHPARARRPRCTRRSPEGTQQDQPRTSPTAEDPVRVQPRRHQPGGRCHEDIGLNFAASLRSFLRQDPDIIHGRRESATSETAEIAIKAALPATSCFHLHTNDAPSP